MKPIFRTAMMGFHKKDVAAFVAKQSNQFEKRISDLNTQIENNQRNFEIEKKALESENAELQKYRDDHDARLKALEQMIELSKSLNGCAQSLETALSDSAEKTDEVSSCLKVCKERLTVAEGYREKAERFDQLAGVLSEIVSGKPCQNTPLVTSEGGEVPAFDFDAESILSAQREISKKLNEYCALLEHLLLDMKEKA